MLPLGATFAKARHVYSAVVRPALSHGSTVWHSPPENKDLPKSADSKMSVIQNKCLRTVSGAYKATPIRTLEAETYIPPMPLYLKHLQVKARYRLQISGQPKSIAKACIDDHAMMITRNEFQLTRFRDWASD